MYVQVWKKIQTKFLWRSVLRGARIKWVRNISLVRKIRKQKMVDFVCFYRYMIKETYYINKD
jgi:hypothetical protein